MNKTIVTTHRQLFASSAIAAAALFGGCADSPKEPVKPIPKSVPGLLVSFDCGACQVKSTVPDLIRTAYASAAAKAGIVIDDHTSVTLTVKEYAERGWGMRSVSLVAGPLAFMVKDEIKGVAMVSNKSVEIDYFYRVPFLGIESVAQKIGEMSFEEVVR